MTNALYYNGTPNPFYELAADEFAVPIDYITNGLAYSLFVRLKSANHEDYKRYLTGRNIAQILDTGRPNEAETTDSSYLAAREFAMNQFLELAVFKGNAPDPEKQKLWLMKHPELMELIGNAGAMSGSKPDIKQADDGSSLFEDEGDTQEISTEIKLAKFEEKKEVLLTLKHQLAIPSEDDRHAYLKTSKSMTSKENKKVCTWNKINYEARGKLYDKLAQGLAGALIQGAQCVEANKADWLPRVPLTWKAIVIIEAFDRVDSKNV